MFAFHQTRITSVLLLLNALILGGEQHLDSLWFIQFTHIILLSLDSSGMQISWFLSVLYFRSIVLLRTLSRGLTAIRKPWPAGQIWPVKIKAFQLVREILSSNKVYSDSVKSQMLTKVDFSCVILHTRNFYKKSESLDESAWRTDVRAHRLSDDQQIGLLSRRTQRPLPVLCLTSAIKICTPRFRSREIIAMSTIEISQTSNLSFCTQRNF